MALGLSGCRALGNQWSYAAARCLGDLWRGAEAHERNPGIIQIFPGDLVREDPVAQPSR